MCSSTRLLHITLRQLARLIGWLQCTVPPKLRQCAKDALMRLRWQASSGSHYLFAIKFRGTDTLLTPKVLAPHADILMRTLLAGDLMTIELAAYDGARPTPVQVSLALELLWLVPGTELVSWSTELVAMAMGKLHALEGWQARVRERWQALATNKLGEMPVVALVPHAVELIAAVEAAHEASRGPCSWNYPYGTTSFERCLEQFVSTHLPVASLAQNIPALRRCRLTGAFARLPLDAVKQHVAELIGDDAFPVLAWLPGAVLEEHTAQLLPALLASRDSPISLVQTVAGKLRADALQPHAQILVETLMQEQDGRPRWKLKEGDYHHVSYYSFELLMQLEWREFAAQLGPLVVRTHLEGEFARSYSHGSYAAAREKIDGVLGQLCSDILAAQAPLIVAYLFNSTALGQASEDGLDVTAYKRDGWWQREPQGFYARHVDKKEWALRADRASKLLSRLPAASLQAHTGALVWLLGELQGKVQAAVASHVKTLSPASLAADAQVLRFARTRLIGSAVKKSREYGLRLVLALVEKAPHALDLMAREAPEDGAAGSSDGGSQTRAERLGSEAITAARGLPETHDVVKLSERLVKAIERPGSVVARAYEDAFAAEFAGQDSEDDEPLSKRLKQAGAGKSAARG